MKAKTRYGVMTHDHSAFDPQYLLWLVGCLLGTTAWIFNRLVRQLDDQEYIVDALKEKVAYKSDLEASEARLRGEIRLIHEHLVIVRDEHEITSHSNRSG